MKIDEQTMDALVEVFRQGAEWPDVPMREDIRSGLQAVLGAMTLEPFAFLGYPDNPVYIHPTCGTVVDVSPLNTGTRDAVDRGECDCENTEPWLRVYVKGRK